MSALADNLIMMRILKMLVTPFNKSDAYKLGIVDENGNKIKSPSTSDERDAYNYLTKFVFNIKKLLNRRNQKTDTKMAHAMFLVKESNILESQEEFSEEEIESMLIIIEESEIDFSDLEEEMSGVAIVNNASKDNPMTKTPLTRKGSFTLPEIKKQEKKKS